MLTNEKKTIKKETSLSGQKKSTTYARLHGARELQH